MAGSNLSPEKRRQNLRTALIMVSIALAIFVGYIIKWWLFSS